MPTKKGKRIQTGVKIVVCPILVDKMESIEIMITHCLFSEGSLQHGRGCPRLSGEEEIILAANCGNKDKTMKY